MRANGGLRIAEERISRRDVIARVSALLGGAALMGGDRLLAVSFAPEALAEVTAQGVGAFSAADVALLDEIADTILPETGTPGAKAAKTGAFMALMVSDVYTTPAQQVFQDGLREVDAATVRAHGRPFMQAMPAERLAVLEALDREQKRVMDARLVLPGEPAHYFRLMKELALLGYFTSDIGCTQAQRYVESPGRYDPCAPHQPGDRAWAPHA